MDAKKYLVAVIAVFVMYSAAAYVIHNMILAPDYEAITSALRGEKEFLQRLPLLYLGNLIFALAFCLIYAKGYEPPKHWFGQGIRYGLILGTLLAPVAFAEYVAYPVPGTLALKWIVFGYLQAILSGVVVAAVYQPPPQSTG
ncbi:MAG: hypothetical protein ACE5H2_10035 [Terriglobia bacterium]